MKIYLFYFFVIIGLFSPDLSKVREEYKNAFNSKEVTIQLNKDLADVDEEDNTILVAYKGAVLTLMSKHSNSTKEKKMYFKEGASLLDFAIEEKPENVEMRCIRLGVQENTPKILKYRSNISEDKQLIISQYNSIQSRDIKSYVKGFVVQSKSFTEEEKVVFN